jgi:hypothetical protein
MNIYRKGIIREIPLDCTPIDIKELNRTSPDLDVIDVTRMKRKEKVMMNSICMYRDLWKIH